MKMVSQNTDSLTLRPEVLITHGDEELVWNILSFDRSSFNDFDMFSHINKYWESFSEEDQSKIFNIYKEIRLVFDEVWDRSKLTSELYVLVANLLDAHNLKDAQHWILYHSGVYFPPDLKIEYNNAVNNPGSREQTYLKEDYIKLVTLTLILRTMIPIWGEFICRTRQEAGTNFKEYYAFQLICKSQLAYSEAIEKLTTYIEFSIIPDKSKSASIIGGISTEDFPIWVLGLVLVRRLCLGDISGVNQKATLVTFIYKYITQKIKGNDNNFAGMVKDKIFDDSGSDGDSNISKLEGYKAKQEIPAGDIILLEYAMRDIYALADKLAPSMDKALLTRALETTAVMNSNIIHDPQIVILQWVMKPLISPRGILYLSKNTIINLLALCQSVLIHRGHHAIAGLCTSIINTNTNEIQISGVDSRARIPKELLEQLFIYYPFTKRVGGKVKTLKPLNQAIIAIDSVAEQFSEKDWLLTIDESLLPLVTEGNTNRRYVIQHNFKITLANLVIEIAKRNWRL
jgi:hypothetical protein